MVCPHGQWGLSQFGHFLDKGEESIFRDFVRTFLMEGLLGYFARLIGDSQPF